MTDAGMGHPIHQDYAEAADLVEGKAHDYAEDDNPFSNFEYAAAMAGITVEQVFVVLIAIKTARLGQLVGNDKEPNNESIDDTLLDSMNYPGLMRAYRRTQEEVYDWKKNPSAFTFHVGDTIGLLGDTNEHNPLRYIITNFDAVNNKVQAKPTAEFQGLLGTEVRHFSPEAIYRG